MQQGRPGRVDGNAVIVLQLPAWPRAAAEACAADDRQGFTADGKVFALSYINKIDTPTDLLIHIV
jgi:hypothetical protein